MNEDQDLQEQTPEDNEAEMVLDGGTSGQDRLGELVKELEEVRQHVLYAQAETQNVRRRLVKDNLDRALAAVAEDLRQDERMKGLLTGIEATSRELDAIFSRNGISRVEAMGQPLDPNRHQAMVEIPSEEAEPGTIVQEMQPGYMMKDRLLRPALVGVAKKP